MNKHLKYSMLLMLILLITISLVHAVIPSIGTTVQANPFESKPTTHANWGLGTLTLPERMRDGDLDTSGDFILGATQTFTIRPTADVAGYTQWPVINPTTPTTHYDKVDDVTSDSDSTYIKMAAVGTYDDLYELGDVTPPVVEGVAKVTVKAVAKRVGAATTATIKLSIQVGGTMYYSSPAITPTTSYATYAYEWTTNPNTGGTWTWAQINALRAGVQGAVTATVDYRVTQLFVEAVAKSGYFELQAFNRTTTPSGVNASFPITFVDLKMKYKAAAAADDGYIIQYTTGTNPWINLTTYVSGAGTLFARITGSEAIRAWAQVADPGADGWDWIEIQSLRFRIVTTMGGTAWDAGIRMYIYEVWATIYSTPIPPSSSTAVSIQPPGVISLMPGQTFFVDLYVQAVTDMFSYEVTINFNTTILTPTTDWFTYYPWTEAGTPEFNDADGKVYVIATMKSPVTVGQAFTGNSPFARIYFTVDSVGETPIVFKRPYPYSFLGDSEGVEITATWYDSEFCGPRYMSAMAAGQPTTIDLSSPDKTQWHELYPHYSLYWNITSWEDNGDGMLSTSDQIDMLNETVHYNATHDISWRYWFHVDNVTITIHWSNTTTGYEASGTAEPEYNTTDPTMYDPSYTRWHQITGPANSTGHSFSRWFIIGGWNDTDSDTYFDAGDQFYWDYEDAEGGTYWATLDAVSHDILVSWKSWIPPEPVYIRKIPVPEFPLGIEILMALTPLITIIYLWRKRPKKKVT